MNSTTNSIANLHNTPAGALASVGNRDNLFAPPAAVARIGTSTLKYRAASGGGGQCWWSQKAVREPTACDPSLYPTPSPIPTSKFIKPSSISNTAAVPIPLLSPPLALSSPSLPISDFDLAAPPSQRHQSSRGSISLPLTPESTPPAPASILAIAQTAESNGQSFFPPSLAPGFLASLLPVPEEAVKASKLSQEVEVVARDGSVWAGVLLEPEAAKAMGLSSVDEVEAEIEKVLCVAVPDGEGVDVREGVEMIMDLASENLAVNRLAMVLNKASPDLRELLHGLLFIGGTLVHAGSPDSPVRKDKKTSGVLQQQAQGERWTVSTDKVLVGIEL